MSDATDAPKLEILTGYWTDLKPHCERGSLFVIDANLDLVDVATRIATDDTQQIETWIQEQAIQRPTNEQINSWDSSDAKAFRFAIVQPYVLIQERPH